MMLIDQLRLYSTSVQSMWKGGQIAHLISTSSKNLEVLPKMYFCLYLGINNREKT